MDIENYDPVEHAEQLIRNNGGCAIDGRVCTEGHCFIKQRWGSPTHCSTENAYERAQIFLQEAAAGCCINIW